MSMDNGEGKEEAAPATSSSSLWERELGSRQKNGVLERASQDVVGRWTGNKPIAERDETKPSPWKVRGVVACGEGGKRCEKEPKKDPKELRRKHNRRSSCFCNDRQTSALQLFTSRSTLEASNKHTPVLNIQVTYTVYACNRQKGYRSSLAPCLFRIQIHS
jgi:hypothetical protein